MKQIFFETAAYEQPQCEMIDLIPETSMMLTSSSVEEGEYEEEENW